MSEFHIKKNQLKLKQLSKIILFTKNTKENTLLIYANHYKLLTHKINRK